MEKENRKWIAAGAVAAVLVAGLIIALWMGRGAKVEDVETPEPQDQDPPLVTLLNLSEVPADVRAAADKLRSSRVGYAIPKADRTYLIISTGSDAVRVALDRAVGQPADGTPSLVDVHLKTDPKGERLLFAAADLPAATEYQFALDGQIGAIPTLYNPHKLPLTHLDEATGMVVLSPVADQLVSGDSLRVWGFARPFEAQFDVRIITEKGREVGSTPVMAAGGAPNWGSFVAEVPIRDENLPEMGLVIFEEEMSGIRVAVPIRFRPPAQLGWFGPIEGGKMDADA